MDYSNLVYVHTIINIVDNPNLIKRLSVLYRDLVIKYFDFTDDTWFMDEGELFDNYQFNRFLCGPIDTTSLNYFCSCVLSCSYKEDKTQFKHLMKISNLTHLQKKVQSLSETIDEIRHENAYLKSSNKGLKIENLNIQKRNLTLNEDNKKLKRLIENL